MKNIVCPALLLLVLIGTRVKMNEHDHIDQMRSIYQECKKGGDRDFMKWCKMTISMFEPDFEMYDGKMDYARESYLRKLQESYFDNKNQTNWYLRMTRLFTITSMIEESMLHQGNRWQQCAKLVQKRGTIALYQRKRKGLNIQRLFIFDHLKCDFVNEWTHLGIKKVHLHCKTGNLEDTIYIFPYMPYVREDSECQHMPLNYDDPPKEKERIIDRSFLYNMHFICQTEKFQTLPSNSEIHLECEDPEKFLEYPPHLGTYYKHAQFLFLSSPNYLDIDFGWTINTMNLPCPYYCKCFVFRCFHLQIRCGTTMWKKKPDLDNFFKGVAQLKPYLSTVEITYSNLERFPMKICQIQTVENLILSNNILLEIPNCVSDIKSLKQIDLSYNKIRTLNLHVLQKLRYLFIHHNRIRRIRTNTFSLTGDSIQELDISHNNIQAVDKHVLQSLNELMVANLSFNEIKEIDFFLPVKLEIVELSDNNINSVPSSVIKPLKMLKRLNLANNKIEKLAKDIFLSKHELVVLNISNNKLKTMNIRMPPKLEELYLNGNEIQVLSNDVFHNVRNLRKLILSNNKIKKIGRGLSKHPADLTTIIELKLNGNLFVSIDDIKLSFKNLQHLDLSHNKIEYVDPDIFEDSNLKEMNLQNNRITDFKTKAVVAWNPMQYLQVLNLSFNRLQSAPLIITILWNNLKELDVSHNEIQIAKWNLDFIDLSEPLGQFRKWFFSNTCKRSLYSKKIASKNYHDGKALSHLTRDPVDSVAYRMPVTSLENNNITLLQDIFNEPAIFSPPDASLLYFYKLSNNPITCDCRIYQYFIQIREMLLKWNETLSEIIDPIQPPPCHSPHSLRSLNLSNTQVLDRVVKLLHCDYKVKVSNISGGSCHYFFYPHNDTLIIDCSNQNLKAIPPILNATFAHPDHEEIIKPETKILIIKGNDIAIINNTAADNLDSFSTIDLSHSNISSIHEYTWLVLLGKVSKLFLNDNNLIHLPKSLPTNLKELNLYNNPWNCGCDQKWLKSWLLNYIDAGIIVKPHLVTCGPQNWNKGRVIHSLPEEDFCFDPRDLQLRETMRYIFLALVLCIVAGVVKEFFHTYKYQLFEFKLHPFDCDECHGEDMTYDVFISYCENDRQSKVLKDLIQTRLDPPYKICDPDDLVAFPRGRPIYDSIADAVTKSKRTLIVLTKAYASNIYCCEEFRTALDHWSVDERQHRLIVIKDIFMDTNTIADDKLRQYLREYTYLELDVNLWKRLLYILPQIPIPHRDGDDMLNEL